MRLTALETVALWASLGASASVLAADLTTGAGATIVLPLQVARLADIEFGTLTPATTAERVTVTYDGRRTGTGPGMLVSAGAAPAGAALVVTGCPHSLFAITLPESAILTSEGDGGEEMRVADFTLSTGQVAVLQADGTQKVGIGATLYLGPMQAPGHYRGSFTVAVDYQ